MFLRQAAIRCFASIHKPRNVIKVQSDSLAQVLSGSGGKIEWQGIREEILASGKRVNAASIDAIIFTMCNQARRLDVAKSYIEFLKSHSMQLNDASMSQLLRMFYYRFEQDESEVSDEDQAEIIKFSRTLIEKHEFLDAKLAENIILAMSLTSEWRECLQLLNRLKELYSPNRLIYSSIIARAIKENDLKTAWMLLNEMLDRQVAPTSSVLQKYFTKFREDHVKTEQMLNLIAEHSIMLPVASLDEFRKAFKSSKASKIDNAGICHSCSETLPSAQLNENEFKHLADTFLNKVFLRGDIFLQTNPDELKRFKDFVERTAPYDCVIDGLNVAYSHGNALKGEDMADNVASVVRYFVDRKQTCLLIGRKHMMKWPTATINYLKKNSSFFLAENLSKDDPFLLYAALKSGPHTKIFSRDLMRGHSHLLDIESFKFFRRWQKQHQYTSFNVVKRRIQVDEPVSFDLRAHKAGDFWHIPFTSENLSFTYDSLEMPSSWLCIDVRPKQ